MKKRTIYCTLFLALYLNGHSVIVAGSNEASGIHSVSSTDQQKNKLTGIVTDSEGALPGVSILVKGTSNGTMSNVDGQYTLSDVPDGAIIVAKSIGYNSKEIKYTGQVSIDFNMEINATGLDEVVVTALGIKREAKQLGYSMQELKGDALLESRESNVLNALSGKVAGLQVMRSGNGVGGSTKIVLRGSNSLTGNNQPLIVIDGIPMDNFTGGVDDPYGNNGRDMGSGLADIDQESIESMSILKGASAAALYGSRAGNGVILITTKQGKERPGIGITVNSGLSIETTFMKPKTQKVFSQGTGGAYDRLSASSWGVKIEGQDVLNWNNETVKLRSYDNYDTFFRPGVAYNESVSFQQNIDGVSIFAAVNRSDETNTTPEAKLSKTGFNLRGTAFLDTQKKWQIDAKANYIVTEAKNRPILGINTSNAYATIYTLPANINLKEFKDHVYLPEGDPNNIYLPTGDMNWWQARDSSSQENPFWVVKNRNNEDNRYRLLGSMKLKYKPTEWLDIELTAGTDNYSTKIYERTGAGSPISKEGRYVEMKELFYENNYSFLTRATKNDLIGKLGGIFTFGGNLLYQNRSSTKADAGELVIPNYFNVNNGKSAISMTSENINRRMNSLYGVMNLSWDNYLYFDVTGRNDWTSTLSKENRSFFYPSFNLAYLPTEMLNTIEVSYPEWLTFLKVRASYAVVGNDLDPYMLYNGFSMDKTVSGVGYLKPNDIKYDQNVKSELIKSWELGLDTRLFDGRLGIDFTWYKKNATRQLLYLPMNQFSGYKSRIVNAGNIQNRGIELALSMDIIDSKASGFKWGAILNFSKNEDKIIDLYEDVSTYPLLAVDDINILAIKGGDYGAIYGKKYLRVTDKDDPNYGKLIVDDNGRPLFTKDNEYIGNQSPKALMGITNHFDYKGFSLSFLVDARFGGKIFSGTTARLNRIGVGEQTVVNGERNKFIIPNSVLQDGSPNTIEITPEQYWTQLATTGNFGLAEEYTYDATNIRLRNITLGYQFNKKQLAKMPIQSLKLSATCNNVWMIHSKLKGIDPESVSATNTNATGFEIFGAPSMRSFVFNLTVGF